MNEPSEVKDFTTHFNYIKCMDRIMTEVKIDIPVVQNAQIDNKLVKKHQNLASLTKNGIDSEIKACKSQAEYAEIVAPWIAVKCYYRIYYLESVVIHLSNGSKFLGHSQIRGKINTYCSVGNITSKLGEAEKVCSVLDAKIHKIKMGSNISQNYYLSPECIKSVRAKTATYLEEQWKHSKKIASYASKVNKEKRDKFRSNQKLSLLDYFYQMRLKANYKDMDFLRFDEITPRQVVDYIELYVSATNKYCNGLQTAINKIVKDRRVII